MRDVIRSLIFTSAVATVPLLSASQVSAQTVFPNDVQQSCPVSADLFNSWITLDSVKAVGTVGPVYDTVSGLPYIFPPDGPDFPDAAVNTDCDFYKWGSQMFLWLTSTVTDTATMPNPVSPTTAETNFVFTSEFFYDLETNDQGQLTLGQQGPQNNTALPMAVRDLKSQDSGALIPVDAEGNSQAGGGGVLISQAANNVTKDSSLVYYGVFTNRVYGYFLNLAGVDTSFPFPNDGASVCINILHGLLGGYAKLDEVSVALFVNYCDPFAHDPKIADGIEQLKAKTKMSDLAALSTSATGIIPSLETAIDYLSMVVELKTSWVRADSLKNPERHIRQMANVYDYTSTSDTLWTRSGVSQEPVELALVGMHIVGTVKDHPENVWVTIEHVDNAPNAGYPYLDTDGNVQLTTETVTAPNGNWLFSDGTFETFITERAVVQSSGNIAAKTGQTIGPVNVNRMVAWGNPNSQDVMSQSNRNADLNSQIISMNATVIQNVTGILNSDPRANYFVSGATWTKNGQLPVTGDESFITGSTMSANTTMETFHQELNCFSCHTNSGSKPVSISHLFQDLQTTLPKVSE